MLDTNVVSELMKDDCNITVGRWFGTAEHLAWLPSTAIAEMAHGVARLPSGARRTMLEGRLTAWRSRLADRILPFGADTALLYGEVLAGSERAGKPMSFADAQIAATAREHGATLATRNVRDFSTTGLRLVNPWEE